MFPIKTLKVFTVLSMAVIASYSLKAQMEIANIEEIPSLKNGTTYVIMNEPNSDPAQKFIAIYEQYWTFSKIVMIEPAEVGQHISPSNSFISFTWKTISGQGFDNNYLYQTLWTCDKAYFGSGKRFQEKFILPIVKLGIFPDLELTHEKKMVHELPYDGEGRLRNWGPGILKNNIQRMMDALNRPRNQDIYHEQLDIHQLRILAEDTLYVPDYVLIKFNYLTGMEMGRHRLNKLMKEYNYEYQMISMEELNKKILEDSMPQYYLNYVQCGTDKFVSIINSRTGESVYSTYGAITHNLNSGDLKKLAKRME